MGSFHPLFDMSIVPDCRRAVNPLPHSVVEVAAAPGGPFLIIRGAGASLTLAFAPSGVVGVFRVHVFGQAMLEVDCCHCVALFVSVSHTCIIP